MNEFPAGDEYPAINPHDLDFMNKPKVVPPAFGPWLSLLAISLTLNCIQFFKVAFQFRGTGGIDDYTGVSVAAQAVVSSWALINLVLLFKRSRRFPKSMIGMLATSAVLNVLIAGWDLRTAAASEALELKVLLVAAPAVSLLWITYLVRSKHVGRVFVR